MADTDGKPLKYYNAIDDCIAQCAAVFGGGLSDWKALKLPDLLKWTNRAILLNTAEENE